MSVIAELSVEGGQFELGRMLETVADATVDIEAVVPTDGSTFPLIWVSGPDRRQFLDLLCESPNVVHATQLDALADRALYRVEWAPEADGLLGALSASHAMVLAANGTPSTWHFELRFVEHDDLTAFQAYCRNRGISLTVHRLYHPSGSGTDRQFGLTADQFEALSVAAAEGYFKIPRTVTLADVADQLGISKQAASERLRRGLDRLVANTLLVGESQLEP